MASAKKTYEKLIETIHSHGTEIVEEIDLGWTVEQVIKKERVVIVLEMLYTKAVKEKSIGAAQQYLDRQLGKPKESLNVTDDGGTLGKLTDDELIKRIATILKATGKAGAG